MIRARITRILGFPTAFYCGAIIGLKRCFDIDNILTRGALGAASTYLYYWVARRNYMFGFRWIPAMAIVSALVAFFERDVNVPLQVERFHEYEKQRMRAIELLDPKRPDYDEVLEKLKMQWA